MSLVKMNASVTEDQVLFFMNSVSCNLCLTVEKTLCKGDLP